MTVTRRADTLCPGDTGRTITGTDTEGTPFHGTLTGGNYTTNTLTLWIGRRPYEVALDARVEVCGVVVPPEPQVVGNLRIERKPA